MHYFVTFVYKVTSQNANNILSTAIASDSVLVSKQVLRCQRAGRLNVSLISERQIISYNKGVVQVNLLSIE